MNGKKYERGLVTKRRILEAAVDLFHEYGFAGTSTRDLVGKVGMSSSAIYNHFPDKNQILFTIIQRAGEKMLAMLEKIVEEYDDPEECLKQMIANMLYAFKAGLMRKEIAIFIDELNQLPKELREICNKQHKQIFNLFEKKVYELKNKEAASLNDKVAAFGVIGAMLWVYHWFRDDGLLSIEEISDDLINLLFYGLIGSQEMSSK